MNNKKKLWTYSKAEVDVHERDSRNWIVFFSLLLMSCPSLLKKKKKQKQICFQTYDVDITLMY